MALKLLSTTTAQENTLNVWDEVKQNSTPVSNTPCSIPIEVRGSPGTLGLPEKKVPAVKILLPFCLQRTTAMACH